MLISPDRAVELMAVDEALARLAKFARRKCRVLELRFFGGLSIEETGTALDISTDSTETVDCLVQGWLPLLYGCDLWEAKQRP